MKYEPDRWAGEPMLRPRGFERLPFGAFRVRDGYVEEFPTDGWRVIKFFERNLCFTNGKWVGQPFVLLPWQKQMMLDMFELRDDGSGKRRYRTAAIFTPKKQGKTECAAGWAHYFMEAAGEPSPSVAVAAAAEDQADLVFGAAKTMAERSPALEGLLEVFDREIRVPGVANARIRRVPANGGKFDGQNLFVGIRDEVHEWLTANQRKMSGMIRGALAVRDNPLDLAISTVGEDETDIEEEEWSPWWRLYQSGLRVESGETQDEQFFFRVWQASEAMDAGTEEGFLAGCEDPGTMPSYGVTVQRPFLQGEWRMRSRAEVIRYYFNRPVAGERGWLEPGQWESCEVAGPIELLPGRPCWFGWDASTKRDSTVLVGVQWQTIDGVERLAVQSWAWERPLVNGEFDSAWRVPTIAVKAQVREVFERLNVLEMDYDPAFIAWVADDLLDQGLPMVEFPQSPARMSPATQALYELISEGILAHDGDPLQNRHIRSVRAQGGRGRGEYLSKGQRGRRVDFAFALMMAVAACRAVNEETSVYESRGVLVL